MVTKSDSFRIKPSNLNRIHAEDIFSYFQITDRSYFSSLPCVLEVSLKALAIVQARALLIYKQHWLFSNTQPGPDPRPPLFERPRCSSALCAMGLSLGQDFLVTRFYPFLFRAFFSRCDIGPAFAGVFGIIFDEAQTLSAFCLPVPLCLWSAAIAMHEWQFGKHHMQSSSTGVYFLDPRGSLVHR